MSNIAWFLGFLIVLVIVGVAIYLYFKYRNQNVSTVFNHGFPQAFRVGKKKIVVWDPNAPAPQLAKRNLASPYGSSTYYVERD